MTMAKAVKKMEPVINDTTQDDWDEMNPQDVEDAELAYTNAMQKKAAERREGAARDARTVNPWDLRKNHTEKRRHQKKLRGTLGDLEQHLDMDAIKVAMANPDNLRLKFIAVMESLRGHTIDREEPILYTMLACLAGTMRPDGRMHGENYLMQGPPGVAKSYVADLFIRCIVLAEGDAFQTQYHKFMTGDEVVGPVDGESLKNTGKLRRMTKGFLPSAWFSVADEAGLAGVSYGVRLKLINEREFKNYDVLMRTCLISEYATTNQEITGALRDRYLVASIVEGIPYTKSNLKRLQKIKSTPFNPPTITLEDIYAFKLKAQDVVIPDDVWDLLPKLYRDVLKIVGESNFSPRTAAAIPKLLQVHAMLNGRMAVEPSDLEILWACFWRQPDHIPALKALVMKIANLEMVTYVGDHTALLKDYKEARVLMALKEKAACEKPENLSEETKKKLAADLVRLMEITVRIGDVASRFKSAIPGLKSEKNRVEVKRLYKELKGWWQECSTAMNGEDLSSAIDPDEEE